jgi:hypothetical protein
VRLKLAPAAALGVVVRNLLVGRRPVYALGEWAASFDPALLGLSGDEVGLLNDDRVGRSLSRLFDADRASLLNRVVLDAITNFDIDVSQLHNDSTTVTFAGSYAAADGQVRGGKATPAVVHGHNKDHRPDLKQLVFILTVTTPPMTSPTSLPGTVWSRWPAGPTSSTSPTPSSPPDRTWTTSPTAAAGS